MDQSRAALHDEHVDYGHYVPGPYIAGVDDLGMVTPLVRHVYVAPGRVVIGNKIVLRNLSKPIDSGLYIVGIISLVAWPSCFVTLSFV